MLSIKLFLDYMDFVETKCAQVQGDWLSWQHQVLHYKTIHWRGEKTKLLYIIVKDFHSAIYNWL